MKKNDRSKGSYSKKKSRLNKPPKPETISEQLHLSEIFLPHDFDRFEKGKLAEYSKFPRVALLGRSNVGKSTLVNLLVGASVAHVSKQPGKTRGIHFYLDRQRKMIWVDVPGYGFASRSQEERNLWSNVMKRYLEIDESLAAIWLLLDSRHGPTPVDEEAIAYVSQFRLPLHLIMTKFDQLKTQKERSIRRIEVDQKVKRILGDEFATQISWITSKNLASIRQLFGMG